MYEYITNCSILKFSVNTWVGEVGSEVADLSCAGEELHLRHQVQGPRARHPRHPLDHHHLPHPTHLLPLSNITLHQPPLHHCVDYLHPRRRLYFRLHNVAVMDS